MRENVYPSFFRNRLGMLIFSLLFLSLNFQSVFSQVSTEYVWQLAYWENYETACTIILSEDRNPTNEEIQRACGDVLYQTWLTTPFCNSHYGADAQTVACTGVFLRRVGERTMDIPTESKLAEYQAQQLQQIRFDVSNVNCEPGTVCAEKPELLLIAHAPDNNDALIRTVNIRVETYEGACDGNACQMRLPATDSSGVWFEYWAMDSDGNQSQHYWLKFRAVLNENNQYVYDALGDAFPNAGAYGSSVWYTFPSVGAASEPVLEKVPTSQYLVTKYAYQLLAEKLIQYGKVDSSACPNYGLNLDGTLNGCGKEVTASLVYTYQNRLDEQIFQAAEKQHVPPRIVKGLIAQESQFWPISDTVYEYGLGKMTESGADMTLRWNTSYFLKICAECFPKDTTRCYKGFSSLSEQEQVLLRGVVIQKAGTDEEVEAIAAAIRGSVSQVAQVVHNATDETPSMVTTYEDMWKFTVANYYSGSGCLYNAMSLVKNYNMPLTWENVRRYMTGTCEKANLYVDRVYELGN